MQGFGRAVSPANCPCLQSSSLSNLVRSFRRASAAAALLCLGLISAGAQTAYTVNNSGDAGNGDGPAGDLRYVITQSNGNPAPGGASNTIGFSGVTGTITLGSALPTITRNVSIMGPGASQLTVSGAKSYQVFSTGSNATVTISGLTIANGSGNYGGGIYAANGTLRVTDSTFDGNSAQFGGGIFDANGALIVTNSTFSGNSAGNGAGIYSDGTLSVTNGTFTGNSSTYFGAGISSNGLTLKVDSSTFSGNSAGEEGGAIVCSNALTVTNSIFSGNSSHHGGAVESVGSLTVSNSVFSGNSALYAGGVFEIDGDGGTITESTLYGNSSSNGGGIYNTATALTVSNVTFANNSASSPGGGIFQELGTLTVNNSIFSGNSTGGYGAGIFSNGGTTTNASYNVFHNNLNSNGYEDDCTATCTNSITGDPKLLPLGNYGGPTESMLPAPGSPAICAGTNTPAGGVTLPSTDQRGWPVNQAACAGSLDIGAVQTNYLTVTTLGDLKHASPDCTSGAGNTCSLRDALTQANTAGYADVGFLPSLFVTGTPALATPGTIPLGSALPSITGTLNLIGPGANLLSVSGNHDSGVGSVFVVNSSATALLYGMTISDGNASTGGGILNSGLLTVMASAVSGNTVNGVGGGIGNNGTLTVSGSTVSGNSVMAIPGNSYGGGYGGGIVNGGTLTVTDSTVSGNSVNGGTSGGFGGGITNNGTLTVNDSTVSGNSASGAQPMGGGVFDNGTLKMNNSIVAGNSVSGSNAAYADCFSTYTENGSNIVNSNETATSNPQLSALQLNGNGATVATMIPLPGSQAICAGSMRNVPAGLSTDERGYPLQPGGGYCPTGLIDAGAVQTNYTSVAFVVQPTAAAMNMAMSPSPTVKIVETDTLLRSNNTDAVNGVPIALSFSGGASELAGGAASLTATTSGGVAAYRLAPAIAGSGFTLSAGSDGSGIVVFDGVTLTATSNSFNVYGRATQLAVSAATPVTAGGSSTVTVTAKDAGGLTVLNDNDTVNVTISGQTTPLASIALSAGTGSEAVELTTAGSYTLTATDTTSPLIAGTSNPVSVSAALPAAIAASAGTPQSAYIYTAFAPLTVAVTDSFGNGVSGVTVNFSAPASATSASLDSSSCHTGATGTCSLTATANGTAGGPYTVTATAAGIGGAATFSLTNNPAPNLVVTSTGDDAGSASNCTAQTSATTGTDSSCSLRDALLEAANLGTANVYFDTAKFAGPTTIQLLASSSTALTIPSFTTVTGPAPTLVNGVNTPAVTISGAGPLWNLPDFEVLPGVTGAAIANLTIANGNSGRSGGGIANMGSLTVTNSTFSGNNAATNGGGIFNDGTLTVTSSTFSGNRANIGGAICNTGTLTVNAGTISGNAAFSTGGGIYNSVSLGLANSIVSGNWLTNGVGITAYDDLDDSTGGNAFAGSASDSRGNLLGFYNNPQVAAPTLANLAALANFGGSTKTMIPLPGSPAICAGTATPAGGLPLPSTDQRGQARTNTAYPGYSSTPCVDSGAVQTNYALSFSTQPAPISPATTITPNAAFGAAVTLKESGNLFMPAAGPISLLLTGNGSLSGGSAVSVNGMATYSTLKVSATGTSDTLTATLALNPAASPAPSISSAPSSAFNVKQLTPAITFMPLPAAQIYGSAIVAGTLDAIAKFNGNPVAGTFAYTATVNGSQQTLTAGTSILPANGYTLTATFTPQDASMYTSASATAAYTVNKAAPNLALTCPTSTYDGQAHSCTGSATGASGGAVSGTWSLNPASKIAAGGYLVTGTFASTDSNYTGGTAQGTLTVNKATLLATANNQSKIYGAALPSLTYTLSGFVHGDTAATATSGKPSLSTAATSKSPVDSYTISVSAGTLGSSNYGFAFKSGTLAVTKAELTVAANNASKVYGAPLPNFSDTVTGFVNGDAAATAVRGQASLTTSATAKSPVRAYAIVAAAGTLSASNYSFTFKPGTLTIAKAVLTVTATNASVAYNKPLPKLAFVVTGYLNGDTSSALTGAPVETTTAKQGSLPGAYPITITQGTLTATNYSFLFKDGAVTITPLGTVETPTIKPGTGTYSTSQNVTISDGSAAATIYYTTNGVVPTTSSTKYNAVIKVSGTETIKAIAVVPGYTQSAVATATYTFK
jgi:hypothetical protein